LDRRQRPFEKNTAYFVELVAVVRYITLGFFNVILASIALAVTHIKRDVGYGV
jgi:hypothetical protein